jgi:P4 family phage/plasmid primase-like protien
MVLDSEREALDEGTTMLRKFSLRTIRRLVAIGNPVIIPQSLITKLKAFGPHFIKVAKPVPRDNRSGKNAVEKAWQENPYEAESKELQNWLVTGNNYGVMAGQGVAIIDLDVKKLAEEFEAKVETFTVKSGRVDGEGRHYYFRSDATENGLIFDDKGNQAGNIQVHNKFVVGPGCRHHSGGVYLLIKDVPLAWVSKSDLEGIFGDGLKWTGQIRAQDVEEAEEEKTQIKTEIPMALLVDLTEFERRVNEYQGAHPLHGSTTGKNFCVNIKQNVWHCFRCNSGGGGLMWIAVKHGILRCHEARKGALRGLKFIEAVKLAQVEGFQIKVPEEELSPDVARFFEEKKFIPALVAKELMEEAHYVTRIADQSIFRYNTKKGVYEEILDIRIGKKIVENLGKHWLNSRQNEVIAYLKTSTAEELPELSEGLIAVKNGILNTYTRKLKPFSHEFFVINSMPVIYNPEADCPKFKTFLNEVVPLEKDRESLQQFLGYTLSPNCKYQKALMLVGTGANGKSTLLTTWTELLGEDNISNLPLQTIQMHKFALARLYGKMANIYPDLPSIALKETDAFKTLVSGERVEAEKKFKPFFSFPNIAKLVFSCNQPPTPPDDSDAYWRRWIIIRFPNQFLEDNPRTDPDLLQKLTTPEELSGILNWALEGLDTLTKEKKFTVSKTMEDTRKQYLFLGDPIKAFTEAKLELAFEKDRYLDKLKVYEAYLQFCEDNNLPYVSRIIFSRELPSRISCINGRIRENGEVVRVWKNIKFKETTDIEE